jgi:hypothetical protein
MTKPQAIPPIPVTCLAEFITRGRRSAESVLRPFKFSDIDEGRARVIFRPPVLTVIRRYYKSGRHQAVIDEAINAWQEKAEATEKKAVRSRLRSNVSGLKLFLRRYGDKEFEVLPVRKISCRIEQLTFTAPPDLWVRMNGREKLIKLCFGKRKRAYAEVILLVMRRAALQHGYRVHRRDAMYVNVLTGQEIVANFAFRQAILTLSGAARDITRMWLNVSRSTATASPFMKRTEPTMIIHRD